VGVSEISSANHKSANLWTFTKFVGFVDCPQMWQLVDLQLADPIFFEDLQLPQNRKIFLLTKIGLKYSDSNLYKTKFHRTSQRPNFSDWLTSEVSGEMSPRICRIAV
jgi:hypothetical protein